MLEQPHYRADAALTASDLEAESRYLWERGRRHNMHLHGWGVVCGLRVIPADLPRLPWAVAICPGYAVSPCGDEIVVCCSITVDLREALWSRPLIGGKPAPAAYVGLRYAVDDARLITLTGGRCTCVDPDYRPSHVLDSYRVTVLWELPSQGERRVDLCSGETGPCPRVPDPPVVVLAAVTLPVSEAASITGASIQLLANQT